MTIVFRFAVGVFAVALIVFGAVWLVSPIPLGVVFMSFGVILLAMVAPAAVRGVRKRWRWFDKVLHALERVLPAWAARHLAASDHEHEDEEENEERRKSDEERRTAIKRHNGRQAGANRR